MRRLRFLGLPPMNASPDIKKQLRKLALSRRDALDPLWRIEASLAIAEAAEAIGIEPGAALSGYWPMRSEMDVRPLMDALRAMGARLCLPAILDRETIVFRELVRGAEMIDMGFGTSGPAPDAAVLEPQLMLMPLAAFDVRGHRIGYGGGYYDRAIARLHAKGAAPRLIGVAFDCQEIPEVPAEPHDVVLHAVLTETGLRRFPPQPRAHR